MSKVFGLLVAGKDLLGKEYSDSTVREMLTGQKDLPFEGQGASDFLAVTGLEGVPQWAQNLLRHLLRRNPLLRMTSQDVSLLLRTQKYAQFRKFDGNLEILLHQS